MSDISRRSFIQKAATTAAACAVVPNAVIGAPRRTQRKRV